MGRVRRSLRDRTIAGERAMRHAESEGRTLIGEHGDALVRSYAAAGLLTAAIAELQAGAPREVAVETLRTALLEMDGLPS